MSEENEAAEIVAELEARHRDVLEPVIRRINRCVANHAGDDIFYLYQSLVTLTQSIHEMLSNGRFVSKDGKSVGTQ